MRQIGGETTDWAQTQMAEGYTMPLWKLKCWMEERVNKCAMSDVSNARML
jgi:hypothetical protein